MPALTAPPADKYELLPGMIAMSLIAILAFIIVCLFLKPMPMTESAGTLAIALASAIGTNIGVIVGFFYGANKDSRAQAETTRSQSETIASMAAVPAAVAAAAPAIAAAVVANATAATNGAAETAAWGEADAANTTDALNAYLAKYPTGVHAPEARARLAAAGG